MGRANKQFSQGNKKIKCLGNCGRELVLTSHNFFKSNNPEFVKYEGFSPICKQCSREMIFNNDNTVNLDNFKKVLKYLDKPFIRSIFEEMLIDGFTLGDYTSRLNFGQYRTMGYKDSDENVSSKEKIYTTEKSNYQVTNDDVKLWGKGYSAEDYDFLNVSYKEWTTRYKCDTLAEEKTYKFLCLKELEIRNKRERNEDVDKLEETFRKLMSDANVTPKDANSANDAENVNSLGMWIKDIERYRPAEYFKDKKLYHDYDGIKDYLDRFVLRPLKNLLTGSRDFDKEFNVEENIDDLENELEDGDDNGIT